jgi:hypothetical protein
LQAFWPILLRCPHISGGGLSEANRKEAARNRNNGIFRKPIFQCEKLTELTQTTIIPKKINTRLTDCTGAQPSFCRAALVAAKRRSRATALVLTRKN